MCVYEREREREREREGASERERKKASERERRKIECERERAREHASTRREKARCGRCRCFARSINNAESHRWAHGARRQISFACLHVLQEPKRRVQGATMIKHAQACENMSHGFTRQHAAARSCAPIHRCPSLRLLTCILGNEILFGIVACRRMPTVTQIRQSQGVSECLHPTYCVSILSVK